MTAACPSDLALEGYLFEPGSSDCSSHVEGCECCQSRLTRMRREGEEFARFVYPATVEAVERAAERRRVDWRRLLAFFALPLATAAAAVLIAFRPAGDAGKLALDDTRTQIKGGGGGIGLTVFLGAAGGARMVLDGDAVPASAALRFKVQPSASCWLWLASVDGSGNVSRLFPSSGEDGARIGRGGPLPGGALLDGRAGPERIFAFCAPGPTQWTQVERALRSALGSGEPAVRSRRVIPGLPDGTSQDSVLIHKAR
jgi:hypothetical protein